jgi:hypothetical protein
VLRADLSDLRGREQTQKSAPGLSGIFASGDVEGAAFVEVEGAPGYFPQATVGSVK